MEVTSDLKGTTHIRVGGNKYDELSVSCCNFKDEENGWEDI